MKHVVRCMVLLLAVGLAAAPAFAAELRVTGFFDNIFPHWEQNISGPNSDNDTTRNRDTGTWGRERSRIFFNFIASDDLRGVFALELDNAYGAPSASTGLSGNCIQGTGIYAGEQCGFRNGIDINNFELKHLYVDFRIPQLPIGNRVRLGGWPADVTPLHPLFLYTMDAGGGDLRLTLTDQVSLLLTYVQLEEDLDRFPGSTKLGEDYLTGATLLLNPLPGLDLHLIGLYGHMQAPFGPQLVSTQTGGPFPVIANDTLNVTTESRYYLGFDARYRIGNTSIEPTFIYLLGDRKFCTPGSMTNTTGTAIPCTSPVGSPGSTDYRAFEAQLKLQHTTGPWLFAAKFAYTSGNKANDDFNNRGIGNRSDIKIFHVMGIDGAHIFGEWFEILGKSDVDGVSIQSFRRYGEVGHLDRFGLMLVGGKAEYKATDNLILEGAAGGFWTAEKTACPSVLRVGSLSGPCSGTGSLANSSGQPALNFTGNSKFVGWEVDAGVRYTILPGLTWTPRIGYAGYGDATAANGRSPIGAWTFTNRMIYIF
jgi:hypothetical protein